MRVALLQSNYIPWKGYFDIAHDVDLFVFHDDLQYTKGDWRNRNRVKTPGGVRWLTVPVGTSEHRRICDVALPDGDWGIRHWRRIEAAYRAAPHFDEYRDYVEAVYTRRRWTTLSTLNQTLIVEIARDILGLPTQFRQSTEFGLTRTKGDRVIELLTRVGATTYVSGPAARAYLDEQACADAGVTVEWKRYDGYPEYPQLHPPFAHDVTILDLLFHTGPAAGWHIWGWRDRLARGGAV